MYDWENIKPKLIRFLAPFLVVCILEIILLAMEDKNIHPLRIFLLGAYGPGSYYVPIMMQLLLIFPVIYLLVERNWKWGILISALANLLYELAVVLWQMDEYYYRLCIGRYLLLLAFGCYIYLHPEHRMKKKELIAMLMIGLTYILIEFELEVNLFLFEKWSTTAMPVALYIFPLVILLFRKFYDKKIPGIFGEVFALTGKASYHIFLVQMVYYHFDLGGSWMDLSWYYAIPYDIFCTLPVGILFYFTDGWFLKEIKKRRIFA